MIEKIILDFLSSKVSTPVKTEIPQNPPTNFYLIEKTGGSQAINIKRSTIVIQSYAESLYEAANLNDIVKEYMLGSEGLLTLNEIVSVVLGSDYNYTDTTTKKYRYQAVFEIVHY